MTHGEMIRMREAGFTYREIAAVAGVSWSTIRSRCQRWEIQKGKVVHSRNRPAKHNYPYWLVDMMYWDCKLTVREIAYEFDIPYNSMMTWVTRNNFPLRNKKQAWELMQQRKRGPFHRSWTTEEARRMSALAQEARRKKKEQINA